MFVSRLRGVFVIIVCSLFGIYSVFAQNSEDASVDSAGSEWYLNKPISDFEFKGLDAISRFDLKNVLAEFKGKNFTSSLLEEIQNTLYQLEYFEEIIPEAQKGFGDDLILVFTLKEKPTINKISFNGNQVVGNSALLGLLSIRKGDIFNTFKAENEIKVIQKKYFDLGYPNVDVRYENTRITRC